MNSPVTLTAPSLEAIRARRVQLACDQNAKVDSLIEALETFKKHNVISARNGDSWASYWLHKAGDAWVEVIGDDNLKTLMEICRDELLTDHRYDINQGCFVDDDGDPLRSFDPSRVHPDNPDQSGGWR